MADLGNMFKVWGERRRLLLTATSEIDLLYLKGDSFCSLHLHHKKINKFVVIKGSVRIESEYGKVILRPNESFEIRPPLKHRFFALEPSVVIELAYVEKGKINANDIIRVSQGGRVIKGEEMTLDEMRFKGLLEL